jgi:hypothetical protein
VLGADKSCYDGKKRMHDIRRLENRRKHNARGVGAVRMQQTCDCVVDVRVGQRDRRNILRDRVRLANSPNSHPNGQRKLRNDGPFNGSLPNHGLDWRRQAELPRLYTDWPIGIV